MSPSLATEFQATLFPGKVFCSSEHQIMNIQTEILSKMTKIGLGKNDKNFGHRAPSKNSYKTFSTADIARLEKAIKDKEDIRKLSSEIGRSFNSVYSKIYMLKKYSGLKKGKLSDEEIERVGLAVEKHEDYKEVAKELCRPPEAVYNKMQQMLGRAKKTRGKFGLEEDFLILERIIPRLRDQKLSSVALLRSSDLRKLAEETGRACDNLRKRWQKRVQPWLLQHYTGTCGFRIERLLTSLIAEQFSD